MYKLKDKVLVQVMEDSGVVWKPGEVCGITHMMNPLYDVIFSPAKIMLYVPAERLRAG